MTRAPSITLGGRYHLVERLAVGGMGEVWHAEDEVLGRAVAIKVLREEHAGDPEFRRRFRAEAQHAAMLVHPNVAQVFDFGEGSEAVGDPPYLVMELIRGEPLSRLLEREGPLSAEQTWSLLGQAASALAAAHDAGVVHRDIKPANLLLCADGNVKVTDFGIARAVGASAVTTGGDMLGTPHYISPEQVSGEPVTAASDFYALGVVAYECLTGQRLYDGDAVTVLLAHRDRPAPALPAGVPAGLRDLVVALLDKDPSRRPTDGRAIAAQAERFNAPTVTMPVLSDPYPSGPPHPVSGGSDADQAPPVPAVVPTGVLPGPVAHRPVGRVGRVGRAWVAAAAAVVLIAAGAIVALVVSSQSGPRPARSATGAHTPAARVVAVHVASATPVGGGDHPEEARLAIDGSATSSWWTQHYASGAFGGLRSGTGLLFDLGHTVSVKSVRLRFPVAGLAVQVKAGASPDAAAAAAPVASAASAGMSWDVRVAGSARYWLVWFTRLAPSDGAYRAGIADATFAA